MDIDKRIEAMKGRLERSMPCQMTITLKSGKQIAAAPADAWDIVRDPMKRESVVSVTANRPDYAASADIMTVLCHPAPNRRIADYE